MRILADQNIPRHTVHALRTEGHDVVWAQTACPGEPDHVLLTKAIQEHRAILTFDKDFGGLAFHTNLPAACGIILLRFTPARPSAVTSTVLAALETRAVWSGYFSVIEKERIRARPLE